MGNPYDGDIPNFATDISYFSKKVFNLTQYIFMLSQEQFYGNYLTCKGYKIK